MSSVINKIEDFLLKGNWVAKKINADTWVINDEYEGIDNLVIYYQDPLVIYRIKIMDIPSAHKEVFYEKLLRLNAQSMTHGAYALEGNSVVIIDTLEAENLDFNEFQASIEAIYMALASDYKVLKDFKK